MCLEIKDSVVAKCPENIFGTLKIGQNEKPYILWQTEIPEINGLNVQLFENFQNLIPLQVWCLGFIKISEDFANKTD